MLTNYSIIKISGQDAEKFLQGQLSNDLALLKDTPWQLSCYCNQKGRVIAFLWVILHENAYYLCLPSSALELTLADLKKFGAFSKIDISMPEELNLVAMFHEHDYKPHEKALVSMSLTPKVTVALLHKTLEIAEINNSKEWELTNINHELPIISKEQQEKFTPHQLNLQNKSALAFKKGCYRGQEIVARMEYLGKLKQTLYRVEIKGEIALEALSPIVSPEDKNIGEIVNIVATAPNQYKALAVLNKTAIEAANTGIIALKDGQELKVL